MKKRLVDARNLEPDLPITTPPKFKFTPDQVTVRPVNDIGNQQSNNNDENDKKKKKHFVVVGGGKTEMYAVYHLILAIPFSRRIQSFPTRGALFSRQDCTAVVETHFAFIAKFVPVTVDNAFVWGLFQAERQIQKGQ